MKRSFRHLEINGGLVIQDSILRLQLPPGGDGYADAQIDDYGGLNRRSYLWRPGTRLGLSARFSHSSERLAGTAGFGFWNAPFGDPTVRWPALPQAVWFFYASEPSDLPFPEQGPGRGWFAGTIDASTPRAMLLAPFALPVMAANNIASLRRRLWPAVRRRLSISYAPIDCTLTDWHRYGLEWRGDGCRFYIDGQLHFETDFRPVGPLGFVCWLDNQYMVATPRGRLGWGTRKLPGVQWLEIDDLRLSQTEKSADGRF